MVFAASVRPYMMQSSGNPDGPLTAEKAKDQRHALELDRHTFFDHFTTDFRDDLKQVTVPTQVTERALPIFSVVRLPAT